MRKVNKNANFYLAILVSLIFAVALVFAISTDSSVKTLSNGTPEKLVQEYLDAVNDGRNEDAAALFSSSSSCTVDDIDRAYIDTSAQVILDKVVTNDETHAIVYISIQRSDGPLMSDPYVDKENYRLVKQDGQWKLSGIPWPLYECGGVFK